jgi:aldehyde dehydrogenase (NAD+)
MTVIGAVWSSRNRWTTLYSTRRLIIHESIYDTVKDAVVSAYGQLRIGNFR